MDFVEVLSETSKRRRLLGALAVVLVLSVTLVALGLALAIPSLAVVGVLMLAGLVGVVCKVVASLAVQLAGTARRLHTLNDRYDDTEVWLEQFDKGTRATFGNITKSLGEAQSDRQRLHAEVAARAGELTKASARIEEVSQRSATREALDASVKAAEAEAKKLAAAVDALRKADEQAGVARGELGKRLEELSAGVKAFERSAKELREADERLGAMLDGLREDQAKRAQEIERRLTERVGSAESSAEKALAATNERVAAIGAGAADAAAMAGRLRGDGYVQFSRLLGDEFIKRVQEELGPRLGVKVSPKELRYLERKIQSIEELCEGRLATTAEDAVTRVLAARSCAAEEIRVLEIGVLFGVGAAIMHTALSPFCRRVHLVLLDPFDGYYGPEHLDPLTGQRVTLAAVERNLARATIPREDVTVLAGFSTDDAVRERAREAGPYDVILIDGDHSYDGVKADFERYAEMLSPGGVLIVDDYGSKDWPEVTRFVDEVVVGDDRFERVGVLSRTAIFRRLAAGRGAKKAGEAAAVAAEIRAGSDSKVSKPTKAARGPSKQASQSPKSGAVPKSEPEAKSEGISEPEPVIVETPAKPARKPGKRAGARGERGA